MGSGVSAIETRQGKGSPGEMRQLVGDVVGEVTAPCECSSEDFLTWMEELTRSQRQTWDLATSTTSVRSCNAGAIGRQHVVCTQSCPSLEVGGSRSDR